MAEQGSTTTSLPPNAILLHAGLPKTGSTALQSVASAKRPELLEHGVLYPGEPRPFHTVALVSLLRSLSTNPKVRARLARGGLRIWADLLREVRAEKQRRVWLSSESVTSATAAQAAAIANELGDRLHVVITLRPLGDRMMSLWQQRVRRGRTKVGLDEWMRQVLPAEVGGEPTQRARKYLEFSDKIQRWVDVLGPERVIIVVVDKAKPDQLYRSFEQLLELPEGMLDVPAEQRAGMRSNRGMSATEVELARRISVAAAEFGLSGADYRRLLHRGAFVRIQYQRDAAPDEGRLQLSPWAAERLRAAAAANISAIESMGVRVIGDLQSLIEEPRIGEEPEITSVPIDAAVQAVLGAVAVATGADPVATTARAAKKPRKGQGGGAKSGARNEAGAKPAGEAGPKQAGPRQAGPRQAGAKKPVTKKTPGAPVRRPAAKPPTFTSRVRRRVARMFGR